ncbi:bifunctional phosphoglucose/phosphomannose isomerase [Candidatus Woesearchaeota archaeon]|nr:bifunctional phosphoglucose/phosphomannose isomerase [Candidatus Woesearchaeota archaeon]
MEEQKKEDYEELIESLDTHNVRAVFRNFSEQIYKGVASAANINIIEEINKIVICGMGGSALPGYLLKQYLYDIPIPIFVVEDYDLPSYVDKETLVFAVSYSGNTEETISAYKQAIKSGAKTIAISSGGKLKELCEINKTPLISVIPSYAPRQAYGILFFPMLKVLENSKIIPEENENIKKLLLALKKTNFEDMGRTLANRLLNKTPLIYASSSLGVAAWKWRINLNENTKILAFSNVFPALDHNELNGFDQVIGDYYVIILRDEKESKKLAKRIEATKKLIKEKGVQVTEVGITGDCYLTRLFSAILIGDWATYYLSIMYEKNPYSTPMIDKLKELLR